MPVTSIDPPVLGHFFCSVVNVTGAPPLPMDTTTKPRAAAGNDQGTNDTPKPLPKGIILGPDGKPCRSCNSFASMMQFKKQIPAATPSRQAASALGPPADCPPDVDELGRSAWSLLHTMTASYPESPSIAQQQDMKQFIGLFGKFYPCWVCADDFRAWMQQGNEPRVSNRDEFGRWMCAAHNAVNVKLGKASFDCDKWEERWRTGWKDGRCD